MLEKLKFILTGAEKKRLIFLFLCILILAVLETFSIGIIIPIINLFVNRQRIYTSGILQWLYRLIGVKDSVGFLTVLILIAILLFVFKSFYNIFMLYYQRRSISNMGVRIKDELFTAYMERPYSFHLENNSSILFRNMTLSVDHVTGSLLLPIMLVGTEVIVLAGIFFLLIYLYPAATLLLGGLMTLLMVLINKLFRERVRRYAYERMKASESIHKTGLEALQAVKEIKIYDTRNFFEKIYAEAQKRHTDSHVKFNVVSLLPRYTLEGVLCTAILLTLLFALHFHKSPSVFIPMLTAFGLAALRILPSTHKIYMYSNTIRYHLNSLDIIYDALKESAAEKISRLAVLPSETAPVSDKAQPIRLEDVKFRYKTARDPIFEKICLEIKQYEVVAFVGETGSGKSTLVDILMGLLVPDEGVLYYGETVISPNNVSVYRGKISYVPQNIFLLDDTLEANIAFGVPEEKIDRGQLKNVIRISQLESFINDLPDGVKTVIGEKGVRLSGGQRQRVAIARALYHDPEILIMDEATSALDGYTEAELNKAVKSLYGKLTIIIIAHRISTIRYADTIYVMDRGKIVGKGTFDELLKNCAEFRKIANQTLLEEEGIRNAKE